MPAAPSIQVLGEHLSLRERIANHLRAAIVSGELPANMHLMEPELARRLGASRTPLREAIRQLEAEGFLTTVPRVGTFVTELTARDLEDVYAIRAALEGLAARQAAQQAGEATGGALQRLLAESAAHTHDYQAYHAMAGRFHDAIMAASGNQRLQAISHTLTHQVARLRTLSLAEGQRPEVSLREHRRIAAAILAGRGAEAEQLMRRHVEGALAVVRRRIRPPAALPPSQSISRQRRTR
jgi:DNA-binding GntR family transcriptional regulator